MVGSPWPGSSFKISTWDVSRVNDDVEVESLAFEATSLSLVSPVAAWSPVENPNRIRISELPRKGSCLIV